MECQACGRPLTHYTDTQVACKGGHVWTLPKHADQPVLKGPDTPALRPTRRRNRVPLWPLAALPGIAALILQFVH